MNPPIPPNDDNDDLDDIKRRQKEASQRILDSMKTASETEVLQRKLLDTVSQSVLDNAELKKQLVNSLQEIPRQTRAQVEEEFEDQAEKNKENQLKANEDLVTKVKYNDSDLRFLIHAYGMTTLAVLVAIFGFILARSHFQ